MTLPWFKVFPEKLLSDDEILLMPLAHQGALFRMWCLAAKNDGLPINPALVHKMLGNPPEVSVEDIERILDAKFTVEVGGGKVHAAFMLNEHRKYLELLEKRKAASAAGVAARAKSNNHVVDHVVDQVVDHMVDHVVTETEAETETEKASPPTPSKDGARKRRTREEIFLGFSDAAKRVVNALGPSWGPKCSTKYPMSVPEFGQNVTDLLRSFPTLTAEICIEAGRDYLNERRPDHLSPQVFFRPPSTRNSTPPCMAYINGVINRLRKETA